MYNQNITKLISVQRMRGIHREVNREYSEGSKENNECSRILRVDALIINCVNYWKPARANSIFMDNQ